MPRSPGDVRFSNRPVWVKRFQTIHDSGDRGRSRARAFSTKSAHGPFHHGIPVTRVELRPNSLGFAKAGRHIDSSPIGQRYPRADTRDRHQAPASGGPIFDHSFDIIIYILGRGARHRGAGATARPHRLSCIDRSQKYIRQRRETNGLSAPPPRNFELRCQYVSDRSQMCECRGM
jgi:hypothetical protein